MSTKDRTDRTKDHTDHTDRTDRTDSRDHLKGTARTALWASVFGGAGVLHFAQRRIFDSLVPEELPGERRYWTWGSGVMELMLAAAIIRPTSRAQVGTPAAWFLAGVWPGNIKMACDWQRDDRKSTAMKVGAWARVIAQAPMIASVRKLK
jgi:uncharacterized membrane protein